MSQITKPIDKVISTPCSVLVVAKRFSGKSHLLKWIVYNLIKAGKFDSILIFTQTGLANKEWDIINEDFIYENFDPEILEKLYNKQRDLWGKGKKSNVCLILDDFIGDVTLNSPIVQKIASTGRHFGISLFLCSQKFTQVVSPLIRENSDYVICFKQPNLNVVKLIWEEYANSFGDFKKFQNFFEKNVANYTALIINNKTQSNVFNDKYSLIKAPAKLPKFRFEF